MKLPKLGFQKSFPNREIISEIVHEVVWGKLNSPLAS